VSMGTAPTETRARTREHFLRSGGSGFYEAGGLSLRVGPAIAAHLISGSEHKGSLSSGTRVPPLTAPSHSSCVDRTLRASTFHNPFKTYFYLGLGQPERFTQVR